MSRQRNFQNRSVFFFYFWYWDVFLLRSNDNEANGENYLHIFALSHSAGINSSVRERIRKLGSSISLRDYTGKLYCMSYTFFHSLYIISSICYKSNKTILFIMFIISIFTRGYISRVVRNNIETRLSFTFLLPNDCFFAVLWALQGVHFGMAF